jgi:HSP20 family protein
MVFSLINRPISYPATRDPFSLMDTLFEDWAGTRARNNSLVAKARIDVAEKDNTYEVKAELPGVAKEDIAVDIEGASISIQAKLVDASKKKVSVCCIQSAVRNHLPAHLSCRNQ